MRSRVIAGLVVLAGCGASHGRGEVVPEPAGDLTVFGDIGVHVQLFAYDDDEDEGGAMPPDRGPKPQLMSGVTVTINSGLREDRVPGLQIFASGVELREFSSAGVPQRFNFQHGAPPAPEVAPVVLEFRLAESRYALDIEPLAIELTAPANGARVPRGESLELGWAPSGLPPSDLRVTGGGGVDCEVEATVQSKTTESAVLALARPDDDPAIPCAMRANLTWSDDSRPDDTPFVGLVVLRQIRRTQRFFVE